LFSPTYDEIIFRICRARSSTPRPKSSTPQLLETKVRSFTPSSFRARMEFSGMPQRPNPPARIVAPEGTSATASRAVAKTLFMARRDYRNERGGARETRGNLAGPPGCWYPGEAMMRPRSAGWICATVLFVLSPALAGATSAHGRQAFTGPRPLLVPGKSIGSPNEGQLLGGSEIRETPYLRVLPGHGNRWGLPHLVGLLDRSARRVSQRFSGSVMRVGDLSRRGGGDVSGHHSHESGRDADVAFYVTGGDRKPVMPGRLYAFEPDGKAEGGRIVFDDARNWAFIEALLTDPIARVNRVFVAEHIRARILAHAKRIGASSTLRSRAAEVLFQPKGAVHDDHFHVRIGCPEGQRGTCLEYVTREARRARTAQRARSSHPSHQQKPHPAAPKLSAAVAAPDDFDDAEADAREVTPQQDEDGEIRIAH
jgi:penicillin-insensitive murein DD-endopeptidase